MFFPVAPEPVANCTTINPSAEHFRLSCKPGFDGGMEQQFEVTVRQTNSAHIVYNVSTTKLEKLDIKNLSAGVSYTATVTPRNKKGPGQSINFEFDTIMHPEVELTQVEDAGRSAAASGENDSLNGNGGFFDNDLSLMIAGVFAGGIVSFGVLAAVGFVARQCVTRRRGGNSRRSSMRRHSNINNHSNNGSNIGGHHSNLETTIISQNGSNGKTTMIQVITNKLILRLPISYSILPK
jgi:hypothetical protein